MKSTKRHPVLVVVGALAFYFLTLHPPMQAQSGISGEHWVGTWTTSDVGRPQTPPTPAPPAPAAAPVPGQPPLSPPAPVPAVPAPFMHFNNQTLRQVVHTSIGGNRARVVLSNRFGTAPLTIGAAHVALRDKEAAIVPQSDRSLTFSGRPTITIPSGAMVYSDPVELNVPPMADLAIDLYCPATPTRRRRSRCTMARFRPTTFRRPAITREWPPCRWSRRRRRGSSFRGWR